MSDPFKAKTLKRKNHKGLALSGPPAKSANPSESDAQTPGGLGDSENNASDTLEIGLEFKLDLKSEDLVVLKELGAGNGGTVSKVMHASTKVVMARKIIRVDAKENVRKQIVRELQIGHDCSSPYVITFYGAFQNEARDIVLCMEYMDCGSLDHISKDFGPVRVDVLGKITESVLGGLVYLYEAHRIMHRDIKPSNVLVNSRGQIKLCDFGVATETVGSIANTFVGTSTYMAPERISGGAYTVKSDVWSVGLTIMELAIGRFPFDSGDAALEDRANAGPMGILDLLQTIVHEPAPKLPKSEAFPSILDDFCAKCLLKDPAERPTPRELYDKDNFLQAAKRTPVNLQEWTVSMMNRHNRKSYLAPPAPKTLTRDGTRDALASAQIQSNSASSRDSSSPSSHMIATPTSAEMPMAPPIMGVQVSKDYTPGHPGFAQKSPPPPLSLEHLSLETQDMANGQPSRSNRQYYSSRDNIPEPASAIEQSPRFQQFTQSNRPFYPPRTSSNISAQGPLYSAGLPERRPPPSGPLPVPPGTAGLMGPRRGR